MSAARIVVSVEVPLERVGDLLCSAFEGGSNYWYMIEKYVEPTTLAVRADAATVFKHIDYPLNAGGAVVVSDAKEMGEKEKTVARLDLAAIERGLKLMATEQPRHFADFVSENDDATTGDVFLQLCLFGKLVFG